MSNFSNESEVVLVKRAHADGPFFEETMNAPTVYRDIRAAWLDHDSEEATNFYRLDTKALTVEEITDDFVACYLRERAPHPNDHSTLPLYVKNDADAWDAYCADWHRAQRWFSDARRQGVA